MNNWQKYKIKENYIHDITPESRLIHYDISFCRAGGILNKWIGKKILHIGCNSGSNTVILARLGISCVGVDINTISLEKARKLCEGYHCQAEFIEKNIVDMDLEEKFDGMFCSNVFEHLYPEDLLPAMINLKNHLKPDAIYYIAVPLKDKRKDFAHTIFFDDGDIIKSIFTDAIVTIDNPNSFITLHNNHESLSNSPITR